jgi:hypothetical protein
MKCPRCNDEIEAEVFDPVRELKMSDHEKYILKLRKKRYELRSIDKYLSEARNIWINQKHQYHTPETDLLIGMECIYRYLCDELDEKLKAESQTPVRGK